MKIAIVLMFSVALLTPPVSSLQSVPTATYRMPASMDDGPLRYALSRSFAHQPGAEFNYNGGLTHVLAAVLERATKVSLEDYARVRLFEPLGITDVEWVGDLAGMPAAASGLRMRPRDAAKFGSLYLNAGKWNGRQVIPASWIDLSTRRHFNATRELDRLVALVDLLA